MGGCWDVDAGLSLKYCAENSAPVEQGLWYTRSALYRKVSSAGFRYFEKPMPMETVLTRDGLKASAQRTSVRAPLHFRPKHYCLYSPGFPRSNGSRVYNLTVSQHSSSAHAQISHSPPFIPREQKSLFSTLSEFFARSQISNGEASL